MIPPSAVWLIAILGVVALPGACSRSNPQDGGATGAGATGAGGKAAGGAAGSGNDVGGASGSGGDVGGSSGSAGASGDGSGGAGAGGDAGSGSAAGAGGDGAGGNAATVFWHRDIRPLVEQRCVGCHTQGGIAPFSISNYAEAFEHRSAIAAEVQAQHMPPWLPDASCIQLENDRSQSAADIDEFVTWVLEGAPEGSPDDFEALPPLRGLSRSDVTLELAEPYTPSESPDEYRCFVIAWPGTNVEFVSGFGLEPGNAAIVHHVIAYAAPAAAAAALQEKEDEDAKPGYSCFGGPGIDAPWLAVWAPGTSGKDYPEGTGIRVEPGSKIIVQMHYNLTNGTGSDQTRLNFKVEQQVAQEASVLPFADPKWISEQTMLIPAGVADVKHTYSTFWDKPTTVWGATLHMHSRGTRGALKATAEDATSSCLFSTDRWDFHWQDLYLFKEPVEVAGGSSVSVECHFDNTADNQPVVNGEKLPVRDVNWGERSEDEMCLGLFYVTR